MYTPAGVMVTISVVPATEGVRVPWVVCTAETEEGGDIIVGMSPTLVTVEATVMDEVTPNRGDLSVLGVVV